MNWFLLMIAGLYFGAGTVEILEGNYIRSSLYATFCIK